MALFKKRVVRYIDADGRRCGKNAPGAKLKREKSRKWYGRYRDHDGVLREAALAVNKEAARQMLAELERKAEHTKSGLATPFDEHAGNPLTAHLDSFRRHLEAKGNTPGHIDTTVSRVRAILDACGFKYIRDISAAQVAEYLTDRRNAEKNPISIATSNHFLTAVKGFTRWLVRDRRIDHNPLIHLQRLNTDTDIRRKRRALSEADFAKLLKAAREGDDVCGLSGADRERLYLVAAFTGLRASELASLSRQSFDLDGEQPTVRLQAAYSKHRREDVLPLHPELVARLREWFAEADADDFEPADDDEAVLMLEAAREARRRPLWPGGWAANRHGAEMIRADLQAAGLAYVDDHGRVFDFHALRGQFVTRLARSGVNLQTAQLLARHSDPRLTANHYTHLGTVDLAAAVSLLPAFQTEAAATETIG